MKKNIYVTGSTKELILENAILIPMKLKKEAFALGEAIAESGDFLFQSGIPDGLLKETFLGFIKHRDITNATLALTKKEFHKQNSALKQFSKDFGQPLVISNEKDEFSIMKDCDLVIALPGDSKTMFDIFYANQFGKKIAMIDSTRYYDHLIEQLKTTEAYGIPKDESFNAKIYRNVESFVEAELNNESER